MDSEGKFLVETHGKTVEVNLSRNHKAFLKYVKNYMDKNSDVLLNTGVTKRLVFSSTDDRDIIEKASGVTMNDIKLTLQRHKLVNPSWHKLNNHRWIFISALMIREFTIKKQQEELQAAIMFLTCGLYSILHSKYFSKFLPNENIMDYTINSLSNKFYIKKHGNLLKALVVTATQNHRTYEDKLIEGTDLEILNYVTQLNSRINAFIKAIFNEYEKNRKNKNYINKEKEGREEENYREVDNSSFQIYNIAQNSAINLLSNKVRLKEANTVAKLSGVSSKVLMQAIETLMEKKDKEIEEFVTLILQIFIVDGKNRVEYIGTTKFITETFAIYSKSNINNPRVLRIKEILDSWLTECSPNYVRTERIATKSAFRKAMFQYFVLSTQGIFLKR